MRLDDWYKRLESYAVTRQELISTEPTPMTKEEKKAAQAEQQAQQPVQTAVKPLYTSPSGSVTILPPDEPTVEASAASSTLPPAAQKFAENVGVAEPTFRTASAPKNASKGKPGRAPRSTDKESLDLFSQNTQVPPPAAPVSRESREQLMARLLDPIITLEEAAQLLGVCPTTVRRWTNKGVLQHYRTSGNQRRFRLSHVVGFLGDDGGPTKPRKSGTIQDSRDEDRPMLTMSSPDAGAAEQNGHLKASRSA